MCCARASTARARNESAESTASSVTALGSFTAPDYGMSVAMDFKARLAALDWPAIEQSLWELGYAKTPPVLTPAECTELIALYADDRRFRSRVEMARYKFGVGDYQYFGAPLPPLVEALRVHAYPPLAAIANRWEAALGTATRHPPDLPSLLPLCRRRGRPSPPPRLPPRRDAPRREPRPLRLALHPRRHLPRRTVMASGDPPVGLALRPRTPGRPPPPRHRARRGAPAHRRSCGSRRAAGSRAARGSRAASARRGGT